MRASDSKETKEKKRLNDLRQSAIKEAWIRERELVLQGKGTRNWTVAQQAELIESKKVGGFEGHHMKNVKDYPQFAGDPNNIQFVSYTEHYFGAHDENFKNSTNGRLDTQTGVMHPFEGDELPQMPVIELTDKYEPSQYELTRALGRNFGYQRKEDMKDSRKRHKGEKSTYKIGKT